MLSAMPGPQGWADLPDGLVQSIIARLISTRDLLAFTATCPGWRTAFMSAKPTLRMLFPPFVIQSCAQMSTSRSNNQHTWELIDVANPSTVIHRLSPPSILDKMVFVGCSYGHAIFSYGRSYVVVDVFIGTVVSPPPCPMTNITFLNYSTLTAPPTSPNSHLLISTQYSLFAWRVGNHSWLQCPYSDGQNPIAQIVTFKGQVFARENQKLYTVRLEPQLSMQELAVVWGDNMAEPRLSSPRLVVRGDMLLLLAGRREAFRLDLSAEPAKWVRAVENLAKWAFFLDYADMSQPLSCMNSRRRGTNMYWLNRGGLEVSFDGAGNGFLPSWVLPRMLSCDD